MKIGERGQVTVPKTIRDRFGLKPSTEIAFHIVNGAIVLTKKSRKMNFAKWKGRCKASFARLGYKTADEFVEDVRGR
jgi:AbrB family looped-hinge helix DNA binding protein